jgi:hypothetical protein
MPADQHVFYLHPGVQAMKWVACWLCVAALGCGADTPAPSRGAAGSGSASGTGTRCEAGQSACYCPDGQLSGTQTCDARGQRSACQCNVTAAIEQGVTSMPTEVCPQLPGGATCAARSFVSPQLPASVLFVVDRSGSMNCNAPPVQTVESCNLDPKRLDAQQPTRWDITTAALDETFGSLMGSAATVGLSMFSNDGYCGVDSTPAVGLDVVNPRQFDALSEAMHSADPAGGTPVVGAVISAYHHLHEELRATGNRYVVLITDGEESCGTLGDAQNLGDLQAARARLLQVEVQKALTANIKTFVVGTPGSEGARAFLSELAFQGGTARTPACSHGASDASSGDCHFDLTTERDFAAVLGTTLGKIGSEARGCEFQSPSGGAGESLNVQIRSGATAPSCLPLQAAGCAAGDGFAYSQRSDGAIDYSRVVLCGSSCELAKSDPSAVVDIILGCPILQ